MRSGFVRVLPPLLADLDPPPEPVPIPIRIVADPAPPPASIAGGEGPANQDPPPGKRNDRFYGAWDKFLALEPRRAKKTSTPARKLEEEKKEIEKSEGDGLQVKEGAATSWEQAAHECRQKVAAIVEECKRLNQKYRDAVFDIETNQYCMQSLTGRYPKAVEKIDPPPWIKRVEDIFDNPQFFIDGATATDVHQGNSGDCWFLASLMAVTAKKELIENLCVARDEKVGVYGFVFYRDGEWIYEVIDDKLYLKVGDDDDLCVVRDWDKDKKEGLSLKHDEDKLKDQLQRGGEALYFSHCKSSETWLPLIEKAYAKAHGDYSSIEGGFASEGIEDLTGGVGVVLNPEDIMDKERFWREQLSEVNKKYLFGGGSKPTSSKGFIGSHAYAVLEAWEEGDLKLLKLRNPWGEVEWEGDWSDGSKLWTADMMTKLKHTFGDDGVFWISYKDFLKHFPSINRVRLFSREWQVSQQWTCVNVPWTVDYLDTRFQFTISKQGPVVIVLSQPDDRYFYGLRGRFLFALHFRVYREGEEDDRYIVRSMHNSGSELDFTRSVSAEIEDLSPGAYNVIFKITARRNDITPTAEESILRHAILRKEKLLSVGRRFDYAHTKGNLRAMEQANAKRNQQKRQSRNNDEGKRRRKIAQKEKERRNRRKKRIDGAMQEKRKAFEGKRRETAKRRSRVTENRDNESTQAQAESRTETNSESNGTMNARTPESDVEAVVFAKAEDNAEVESSSQEKNNSANDKKPGAPMRAISDDLVNAQQASASNVKDEICHQNSQRLGQGELEHDESEEYAPSLEPPEELTDNDFDWDSEIDGSVYPDTEDEKSPSSRSLKNEIFKDDPWNATCVLGLRIYSLNSEAKVSVIKSEEDS
ncbi:Hypothetical protein R9X50_00329400 [Acrodontium crateriforme]|uniref:Calpain catalytic domain-containing protein n=1 Tax=Acrodontium crateriforme TaxID=150365 RepID=A0AAQ3R9S7_9PEZI|nr:Hypothetical protein R9X50_00329400 [Acrodontium crateriforme]